MCVKRIWILAFCLSFLFGAGFYLRRPSNVAILIHGCHLNACNWQEIVFGSQEKRGRVFTAVAEAVEQRADLIVWGSGASTKDSLCESEFTFREALDGRLDELAKYAGMSPRWLSDYLRKASLLDLTSKNTSEEIAYALKICKERKIRKLILVSSPTHIARCLQESCKQNCPGTLSVYAKACDTCYEGSSAQDVVIFEPPHRTDRSLLPIHKLMKRLLPLTQDEIFFLDLEALILKHENP